MRRTYSLPRRIVETIRRRPHDLLRRPFLSHDSIACSRVSTPEQRHPERDALRLAPHPPSWSACPSRNVDGTRRNSLRVLLHQQETSLIFNEVPYISSMLVRAGASHQRDTYLRYAPADRSGRSAAPPALSSASRTPSAVIVVASSMVVVVAGWCRVHSARDALLVGPD